SAQQTGAMAEKECGNGSRRRSTPASRVLHPDARAEAVITAQNSLQAHGLAPVGLSLRFLHDFHFHNQLGVLVAVAAVAEQQVTGQQRERGPCQPPEARWSGSFRTRFADAVTPLDGCNLKRWHVFPRPPAICQSPPFPISNLDWRNTIRKTVPFHALW